MPIDPRPLPRPPSVPAASISAPPVSAADRGSPDGPGDDAAGARDPQREPRRARTAWIAAIVVGAVLVVGGGAWLIARRSAHRATTAAGEPAERGRPGRSGAAAGAGADRPVPVMLAPVARRDVPIALEGLGTVTAFKTVNVHSQVEGRLVRVTFTEGQFVHQGDLLAEIDPRPFTIQLHQAEAALARDQAQLRGAERNLERYQAVSAERLIPQQQTDDQRALVEQLRATVQNDRAQIESARLELDYARIRSPLDGVTGIRQIDPGNLVHVADANGIVIVTQMDPIAVIFTLPQDELPRVAQQQALAPLVVQALSRDGSQPLGTGALALIDNQINQTTATMRLKAIFPNPNRSLWPNQFVRTRLEVAVRKGVIVIPAVAVQRGPQNTFAYVVGQNQMAEQRAIVVDSIEGEQAMVSGGLAVGERVVVEGQSQLRPGARVAMREGAGPGGGGRRVGGGDGPAPARQEGGPPGAGRASAAGAEPGTHPDGDERAGGVGAGGRGGRGVVGGQRRAPPASGPPPPTTSGTPP